MKALIADDDLISRRCLEERLRDWGYDLEVAKDGPQALSIMQGDDPPRIAVFDWVMPGMTGPEVCRRLRALQSATYTYVMLLTSMSRREDLLEGLAAGADDYVTKPLDPEVLRMRLRVGRRIVAMHEELHLRATRDWLTGAWNRGAIVGALKREMERASRTRQHVSVVLADVDHFKRINDRHGHLAGDDVLREVVRRIRAVLRPYDTIGRYGGEEFLVVLPNCDGPTAVEIAERMRAATSGLPFAPASVALKVTASFGVAELRADDTIESLVLRADQRLYRAKRSGRNSVIGGSRYAPIFSQRRPPV